MKEIHKGNKTVKQSKAHICYRVYMLHLNCETLVNLIHSTVRERNNTHVNLNCARYVQFINIFYNSDVSNVS